MRDRLGVLRSTDVEKAQLLLVPKNRQNIKSNFELYFSSAVLL